MGDFSVSLQDIFFSSDIIVRVDNLQNVTFQIIKTKYGNR